jgi:hypothetical protein
MSSWLNKYIDVMNIKVGQVWRLVPTKMDSTNTSRLVLLVEEKLRPNGKRWYWTAVDVETGAVSAITPWEKGPDWKWERFA